MIALDDGQRASSESWADLLRSCKRRGMRAPVLAVCGQVPLNEIGTDFFQEVDNDTLFADVSVYSATISDPIPPTVHPTRRLGGATRSSGTTVGVTIIGSGASGPAAAISTSGGGTTTMGGGNRIVKFSVCSDFADARSAAARSWTRSAGASCSVGSSSGSRVLVWDWVAPHSLGSGVCCGRSFRRSSGTASASRPSTCRSPTGSAASSPMARCGSGACM